MTAHLADNHPDWERTATTDTREVLTAKIKLAEGEEDRLKAEMRSSRATAAKRPATSPPNTPRHHRIARTSRTSATFDPNSLGGGDEDDTDADFINFQDPDLARLLQASIVDPPSISGEREPIHDPHEDHQPIRMLTEPSISGDTGRLLIYDPHEDYQPIRMLTEYDWFRYYQFIAPTEDEIKD
ncbi:hypothetical protein B0H14DRAFT_3433039 [Mycena olivaceomarginata]|nr:hypothetical protein B0H14DRAFT_3433039 [Mycena olivaceomarginata]